MEKCTNALFEDENFSAEVLDCGYEDSFLLERSPSGLSVRRTDRDSGWGQNLMLKIRLNPSGEARKVYVGPSGSNHKEVEIVEWNRS